MPLRQKKNRRRIDAARWAAAFNAIPDWLHGQVRRALGLCLAAWAVALLGYGAYAWGRRSPQFGVRALSFQGLHRANEAELVRLSGVALGQNLFELDLVSLSKAMAAHPWVRSVSIRRQFPGSLRVSVLEHEPAALVQLGELYVLDREGEPFKKVQAGDSVDLPLVTGLDRETYVSAPERAVERFRSALALAAAYEASDRPLGPKLSELRLELSGTTLVSSRGIEAHLGAGAPAVELARLGRIAQELKRRALEPEVIRLDNRVRPGWVAVTIAGR